MKHSCKIKKEPKGSFLILQKIYCACIQVKLRVRMYTIKNQNNC